MAALVAAAGVAPTGATAQSFRLVGPQPNWIATQAIGPVKQVIVDVNRDGAPDLLNGWAYPLGTALRCSLNDGTGRLGAPVFFPVPPHLRSTHVGHTDPCMIDLDGDGYLDVVMVAKRYAPPYFPLEFISLRNDTHGGFVPETIQRFSAVQPFFWHRAEAGDFNGDRSPDFLVYDGNYALRLFLNDGAGNFQERLGAFPANGVLGDLALGDLDHDGDVDVAVAYSSGAPAQAWQNDGAGQFGLMATFSFVPSTAIAVHDFDGDGYLDVLYSVTYRVGRPGMEIWINDRRGGFRYDPLRFQVGWPSASMGRDRLDLVDIDSDGDVDIFSATGAGAEVFLDDGTGHFTDGLAALGLQGIWANYALDLDRDGDVDLVRPQVVSGGSWWANTHRNVFTNDPPVGGTLTVDLCAPPAHLATYLLGLARRDTFVPGIGWAGLDPNWSVAWPQVTSIPASRRATLTLPVPADPTLRGVHLWAQSVDVSVATGPRLANLWPIAIQ